MNSIASGTAILKARRAKSNALARAGMRLHGYADDDKEAWSVFYSHVEQYSRSQSTPCASSNRIALALVYENAVTQLSIRKNLL